jgi:hypothetical protein
MNEHVHSLDFVVVISPFLTMVEIP